MCLYMYIHKIIYIYIFICILETTIPRASDPAGDFDPAPLLPALDGFPGERLVNMFPRGRESPAHLGASAGVTGVLVEGAGG